MPISKVKKSGAARTVVTEKVTEIHEVELTKGQVCHAIALYLGVPFGGARLLIKGVTSEDLGAEGLEVQDLSDHTILYGWKTESSLQR